MKRLLSVLAATAVAVPMVGAGSAAAGGGGCHRDLHRDATGVRVSLVDNCFDPAVIRVEPGQRVTWRNDSMQPHSVSGVSMRWGDLETFDNGESVAYAFSKPGTFPYFCFVHPGMVGAVVVGDGVPADSEVQDAGVATSPEPSSAATVTTTVTAPAAAAPAPPPGSGGSGDGAPAGLVIAALVAGAVITLAGVVVFARRPAKVADPAAA